MVSVPGAEEETLPAAVAAEDPTISGGTPSSDLLSIDVANGSYKSIKAPLDWPDIPRLAILTGLNGSGKTQLLEAIDTHYHSYKRVERANTDIEMTVTGAEFDSHGVLLLQTVSKARDFNYGFTELDQQVRSYRQQQRRSGNPYENSVAQLIQQLDAEKGSAITPDEVLEIFYANPSTIERAIAAHFTAYILSHANCLLKDPNPTHDACRKILGPPPWDELNRSLELAGFSYRFLGPAGLNVGEPVPLRLRHIDTDEKFSPSDLSGGEATIIHFLLFNFAARHSSFKLKLLLLDEPDAHLHTSLIHVFLGLLRELTKDYGCRVIMSTHRIETIALAPEESLFVMHREAPRVRKSDDRHRTIRMLTSNIVGILLAGKRPVFVEDLDDAAFYRAALSILKGEEHWERALAPEFVASSTWASKRKMAAGRPLVEDVVSTLRNAGASDVVKGLIDRDAGNQPEDGVVVLDRYSIENYLLDPLVVFAFLLEAGQAPLVGIPEPVQSGLEGTIKSRSNEDLQQIADAVLELIEPHIEPQVSEDERDREVVEYTNGSEVRVPRWLIFRRGHDLMQALRTATSSPRANQRELTKALLKVRLIPESLRQILWEVTGYTN